VELGVQRLLTSGGAQTALEGIEALRGHIERAADRLEVIVAGGVRAHNARRLIEGTGTRALHFSAFAASTPASYARPERVRFSASSLPADSERRATEASLVVELRSALAREA
jgi:copper homeostasis protein